MVCIPLLLAIAFLAVAFGTWGNRYWEWIEEMMADRNGIYSAQSIFYLYKEDLQEGREGQRDELEDDLERIGYNLRVTLDGEIVYDRLTEEDEEAMDDYLEHHGREIQQLAMSTDGVSILRSVFDLNGQECVLEPVDMAEYLRELIAEYETEAQKKKLLILLDDAAKRKRAAIDTKEMHRVFVNLFENSVKYRTRDKSVIRIALADREEWLEIEVSDDGPGVNESEYEKIFESFYRGDKSRTSPGNGSGLGLAIVRQIIGGHHGTIRACAPEGNSLGGLTLQIRLPLLPEEKGEDERL